MAGEGRGELVEEEGVDGVKGQEGGWVRGQYGLRWAWSWSCVIDGQPHRRPIYTV